PRRNELAVRLYNLGHYALLLGLLLLATGAKALVAHPTAPLAPAQATALAAGITLYLAANTAIRRTLGLTPNAARLLAAALVPATIPFGTQVSALAQVAVVVAVLAAAFGHEERGWRA
ncbi:low temperature requirement protein A, partial [Kitasatospora sp. MBT63]|uniref:low temperature requirement protein A n=1 Tax=Kitasatospora sp. MBT63 TaxID=1444768 RepID=UPI0018F29211